jgi:16S rRNA (cytosine967-C5)-methyltransferase
MQPADDQHSRQPSHREPAGTPPIRDGRAAAWWVLAEIGAGRQERATTALAELSLDEREGGLARELSLGIIRHQRLYDCLAGRFLRAGVQPEPLLLSLRLAAHQLFALDRIPVHAAVDASVELLRAHGHQRLTGVANAVLRKLSSLRLGVRDGEGPLGRIAREHWPADAAVLNSLPDQLVADLADRLGPDRQLDALNLVPHLCTRSRPGAPRPNGQGVLRQEGAWTWWSDPHEAINGPVARGEAVVQDRSQGRLVEICHPRPGELVLDLCAAPGGKALAFSDRGCLVVAGDNAAGRIPRLRGNLGAGGRILLQDARRPALPPAFAIVVVDAPCSNSGVLARRPEARWRYCQPYLAQLERLQREFLLAASSLVEPGGRLVYASCSVSPRENQAISHRLDGWRILAEESSWPSRWQGGAYAAVLVRSG